MEESPEDDRIRWTVSSNRESPVLHHDSVYTPDHGPAAAIIALVSQFALRYLSQLLQLLADALIFRLQLVVLLLELLFLLQHRQPVLRRLDLLLRGLGQLPGQPLHLLLLLRGHL